MSVLPCTGGRTAEHALGFVGLSHMDNERLRWAVCVFTWAVRVSHGQCASQMGSVCLTWTVCVSQGQCVSHTGNVCLTRAVCVSQGQCVSHKGSVCLTRAVRVSQGQSVSHIGSMCLTRAECVSYGQSVSHTDSRLCVTDQGDTGGHAVTSCRSVVGLGPVITRLCFNPTV